MPLRIRLTETLTSASYSVSSLGDDMKKPVRCWLNDKASSVCQTSAAESRLMEAEIGMLAREAGHCVVEEVHFSAQNPRFTCQEFGHQTWISVFLLDSLKTKMRRGP